jgi:hypothetical protein
MFGNIGDVIIMTNKELMEEVRHELVSLSGLKAIDGKGDLVSIAGDDLTVAISELIPLDFKDLIDKIDNELDGDESINAFVIDNMIEWGNLITELKYKEPKLYELKESYQALSDEIIEATDFKALYGKNNAEVRKNHVKNELTDQHKEIKELEFRIDYITRRINYLKSLVHVKTTLMEAKYKEM